MSKVIILAVSLVMSVLSFNTVAAAKDRPEEMEIILATFGGEHERDRCDATVRVAKACNKKNTCHVPAIKEMCGATQSLERRYLTVVYACLMDTMTVKATENDIARLECRRSVPGVPSVPVLPR